MEAYQNTDDPGEIIARLLQWVVGMIAVFMILQSCSSPVELELEAPESTPMMESVQE